MQVNPYINLQKKKRNIWIILADVQSIWKTMCVFRAQPIKKKEKEYQKLYDTTCNKNMKNYVINYCKKIEKNMQNTKPNLIYTSFTRNSEFNKRKWHLSIWVTRLYYNQAKVIAKIIVQSYSVELSVFTQYFYHL